MLWWVGFPTFRRTQLYLSLSQSGQTDRCICSSQFRVLIVGYEIVTRLLQEYSATN